MKRFIISILVALAVILLIMAIIPQFFKGKIKELIKKEANAAVEATVDFADVSISLFRNFPNVYVGINEISVTGMEETEKDTLLIVETFSATMSLFDLFSGDYRIRRIQIDRPELFLRVGPDGTENWDVFPAEEDTSGEAGDEDSYRLLLDKVRITDGMIIYQDDELDMYLTLMQFQHTLSGDLTADRSLLKTTTHVGSAYLEYEQLPYFKDAVIDLSADINANLNNGIYHLQENQLSINEVDIEFEGSVGEESGGAWNIMLTFDTPKNTFKSFLSIIPAIYAREFDALQASGDFTMDGFIKGTYSDDLLPSFDINIKAENGSFNYPDLPGSVENIFVTGRIRNPGTKTNDIEVDLNRISFTALENRFDARLYMDNMIADPFIELSVDTRMDLSDVTKIYPLEEGEQLRGIVEGNVQLSGYLSAIENEQYDQFKAIGSVLAQNIRYSTAFLSEPLEIANLQLNLAPAYIDLVNFKATTGENDLRVQGKVEDYLPYALADGTLKGNFLFTSQKLNLNSLLQTQDEPAESSDSVGLTVYEIPANIHFIMNADIQEMQYTDIVMQDVTGTMEVVDRKLLIKDLRSSVLDGRMVLNGKYDTWDPGSPLVDFELQLNSMSISRVARTFFLFDQYAPFAKSVEGGMTANLNFRSLLNNNMLPVLTTITGRGNIQTTRLDVRGVNTMAMLGEKLGISELSGFKTGPVNLSFQVNDGILNLKPFSFNALGIDTELSGWTSFDREIGYDMTLEIPRSVLGGQINDQISALISKAGPIAEDLAAAETIPVTALIGGSLDSPEISLSIADAADDMIKNLKDKAMEELEKKKEEVIGQVKEEAAKVLAEGERRANEVIAEAQKRSDQIMASAQDLAEQTRKEADKQAARIEEEGSAKGVIAAAASKTAAAKVRDEGERQAQNILDEARDKADQVMETARQQAEKIRQEAQQRADQL